MVFDLEGWLAWGVVRFGGSLGEEDYVLGGFFGLWEADVEDSGCWGYF